MHRRSNASWSTGSSSGSGCVSAAAARAGRGGVLLYTIFTDFELGLIRRLPDPESLLGPGLAADAVIE